MVLFRVKDRIDFDYELVSEVASEPLPSRLVKPKSITPHRRQTEDKFDRSIETFIPSGLAKELQHIVANELAKYPAPIQAAAMVVSGRPLYGSKAYVGSAGASEERRGK